MSMLHFIIAWLISVITMTLFSVVVNWFSKYEVREYVLLKWLIDRYPSLPEAPLYIGWVVHFCFGLGFMFIFEGLWVITPNYKTLLWGLAVGGFMGLLGIVGWMAMFYLHPRKPNINFTLYYVQLFFAHIIFSITAFGIYKSFE